MILDNFLEVSISTTQLLSDIGKLEEFGLQAAQTNEVWTHQYGVMGDGACHFGLHDIAFEGPKLSFVVRDLATKVEAFNHIGVAFESTHFSDNQVHEAQFSDPSGQQVRLVEARTYSPVLLDEDSIQLGQFQHILLPRRGHSDKLWHDLQQTEDNQIWVKTDPQCDKLTIVYQLDFEQLIMRGTRNGWKNFSITDDNYGLIKTDLGFNFLVQG